MKHFVAALMASAIALPAMADTLTIAGRDGEFAAALEVAVEAFQEAHHGVEVERLELTGGGLLETVTIAMREGSTAYDVIMLDDPWAPQFMSNGWLTNLDAMGGVDEDFVKPARDVSRHPTGTGPYYAVPFVGNVELFAFNSAIFEKHGLSAPQTWDDVLAAAQTINTSGEASGVVFRGQKANPIVTGFLPILWSHGARIVNENGEATLNSDEAVAALEMFLQIAETAPEGVINYNSTEVRDAIQTGATGMAIEVWPSWVPSMDDPERSQVVGDIEIMAAPGQKEGPAPMLGSWLVAIPETSENKELAREFIDFLTSAEMQKRLALEVGTPPTRASVYADDDVVSAYRWYPAQVKALEQAQPRPRTESWAQIETIMGDYLQLALLGEMTPTDAIAEAHQRIERALEK